MKGGRGLLALVGVLAAGALWTPLAHAGSYDVLSCSIDGGFYPNNAWLAGNNPVGNAAYQTDGSCTKSGDPLVTSLAPNTAYGNGTFAGLWFFAPAGTTITDFKVSLRHAWYAPPLTGYPTERTYTLAKFGDVAYSGTGLFVLAEQDALAKEQHWYGYRGAHQSGAADTGIITATRAGSPRAQAAPDATMMTVSAGCFTDDGSACSLGTAADGSVGFAVFQLYGSRITITDHSAPTLSGPVAGSGLLAPGTRSGDEPLTFSATDNVGIRRSEIVDITDPSNPAVVGTEDNAGCDYTRPRPCPDLKDETIAPSSAIAGRRTLSLRVTDAAGNQSVSPPFAIVARGPLNGVNGGYGARLVAGFPAKVYRGKGKKRHAVFVLRPRHTVSYGKTARVRGTLKNPAGQPIAGADVRVLAREIRLGARYTDTGGVTTGPDGRFQLQVPKGTSRYIRVAYRAYKGDDNFAATSTARLAVRARISARGPRHVRRHGVATFRGRLVGRPFPPRGVVLELQIFQPHVGWRVFGTTRTRKNGRYRVRYHFQPASRGRFTFRMRLRPNDAYPYARGSSRRMRVRVG